METSPRRLRLVPAAAAAVAAAAAAAVVVAAAAAAVAPAAVVVAAACMDTVYFALGDFSLTMAPSTGTRRAGVLSRWRNRTQVYLPRSL